MAITPTTALLQSTWQWISFLPWRSNFWTGHCHCHWKAFPSWWLIFEFTHTSETTELLNYYFPELKLGKYAFTPMFMKKLLPFFKIQNILDMFWDIAESAETGQGNNFTGPTDPICITGTSDFLGKVYDSECRVDKLYQPKFNKYKYK